MARCQEKEIDVKCPKCRTLSKVKANSFFDTIYSCSNCGEVIVVKRLTEE